MENFTHHEETLMQKMTPQHRALMSKFSANERRSMAENVTIENIETIQSWIGSDEEIERMLFWDRGGKFDDPEWQSLTPYDETTATLYDKAKGHFEKLKAEAIESQRRSDLALYSQFNTGLLFTGLAGAVRCDSQGKPDKKGKYFRGIEWRCIGSVEEYINSITLYPIGLNEFEVHFGTRIDDEAEGVTVYTGDSYSLLQLAKLNGEILTDYGYWTKVVDSSGKALILDPKEIREAALYKGERKLCYGEELKLYGSIRMSDMEKALEAADMLSRRFYQRYGLETECYKIGKKYGNFFLMREEKFDYFLPSTPVKETALILITATLVCRRCRREVREFRDFAKSHPHVKIALVNLNSPQFKFYERVFGDMAGGNPENFRRTATGVTPFIIIYAPDENRVLKYREYLSTGKGDQPPSLLKCAKILDKYKK